MTPQNPKVAIRCSEELTNGEHPMRMLTLCFGIITLPVSAMAADVSQDAIDGCIDQLRAVGGPDGQGGSVISTEFSEANSLVMLKDRGETTWRCLVSNDGNVAELSVVAAAEAAV